MKMRWLTVAAFLGLAACSTPKPEPQIASAAPQGGYATGYSAELSRVGTDFGSKRAEARRLEQGFAGYPAELKDPDWKRVGEVVDAADAAGRSWAYVDRLRETEGARTFFDAEQDEIIKKTAGAAQYVVKKKGCDVDVQGTVAQALKDSYGKQLDERLRDASEAEVLIARHRAAIGKENVPALEKQADQVSRASFLVHVALVEDKLRLRRLLDEAEQVKKTGEAFIEAEHAAQNEKGVTDADKKASEERIEAMRKAMASIDSAVEQAKSLEPNLEQQIEEAQKEYADALLGLQTKLREKAK
jgi:hypothetical protein